MDRNEIIAFFDKLAPCWDESNLRNEEVIAEILQKGGIGKNVKVLDVACGTGVLFPDYKKLGADVTGIDISPEMVNVAREKFPDINVLCGDVASFDFEETFDAVMIYNAFPHFINAQKLIESLAGNLRVGGRFSVAHGISEKELEKCHSGSAKKISVPLVKKEVLAEMMSPWFEVDVLISDDRMYMVSGVKRGE